MAFNNMRDKLVRLGSSGLTVSTDAPGLTLFQRLVDSKAIIVEELLSLQSIQKRRLLDDQKPLENLVIPAIVEAFDPETRIGLLTDILCADIYSIFESVDTPKANELICLMHPRVEWVGPWLFLRVSEFTSFGVSPDVVPCKARSTQSDAPCGALAHRCRGYCHRHARHLTQGDAGENFYQHIKIGNLVNPLVHFSGNLTVEELARRLRSKTSLPLAPKRQPSTTTMESRALPRVKIPLQPKAGFTSIQAYVCQDCQHASTDVLKDCLAKGHRIETRVAKSYRFKCNTCHASRTSICRLGPRKPCLVCASSSWMLDSS